MGKLKVQKIFWNKMATKETNKTSGENATEADKKQEWAEMSDDA